MMAPLPTTAHVHMTAKKTLYLANPYGFSAQQRGGPLHELVRALESMGADVWEPFARNNQIDRASAGWAYQIGQADLRDVRAADGLFAVVNGCPPDEGVMVELGLAIAWEKPVFLFRDDFRWWAAGRSGGARRAETRLRHICARRARIKQRTLQRRKRANLQTPHHVAIRSEVSLSNGTQLCHRV